MIEMIERNTAIDGPKINISGAIHGNEKCGTIAIRRFLKELDSGNITLKKGAIRFLPVCNPKAYDQHVRFIEENLNRVIVKNDNPKSYEATLAQYIIPHLEWADVILDLHSYTAADVPFVIAESEQSVPLASQSVCDYMIFGLTDAISNKVDGKSSDTVKAYGYRNNKPSCTVECGQHESEKSPEVAYQTILNVLVHFDMIDDKFARVNNDLTVYHATDVVYKDRAGKFVKEWDNFEPVSAGTLIGVYSDGEEVHVDHDCILFLPNDVNPIGTEWFYTAVAK